MADDAVVLDVADVRRSAVEIPADGPVVVHDPIGGPIGVALAEELGIPTDLISKNASRGMHQSHADWARANEARAKLRWACHELFKHIDVLLTPQVPTTAFAHQTGGNHLSRRLVVDGKKRPYMDHIPWMSLATTAYLPATSAPIMVGSPPVLVLGKNM